MYNRTRGTTGVMYTMGPVPRGPCTQWLVHRGFCTQWVMYTGIVHSVSSTQWVRYTRLPCKLLALSIYFSLNSLQNAGRLCIKPGSIYFITSIRYLPVSSYQQYPHIHPSYHDRQRKHLSRVPSHQALREVMFQIDGSHVLHE